MSNQNPSERISMTQIQLRESYDMLKSGFKVNQSLPPLEGQMFLNSDFGDLSKITGRDSA